MILMATGMSVQRAELIPAKSNGVYFEQKKEIRRRQVKWQNCYRLEQSRNSSPEYSPCECKEDREQEWVCKRFPYCLYQVIY